MTRSAILLLALWLCPAAATEQAPPILREAREIPLPHVEGRIDHFGVDLRGKRVFVCALGNNTAEVIDAAAGKVVHTIAGLSEPQGIAYMRESDRLVIANGADGSCRVFDASTYRQLHLIDLKDEADNIRHDAEPGRVWVGYGNGALALVDVNFGTILQTIPLPGHPESFRLEKRGSRIFVNVPTACQIAIVDRKQGKAVAAWRLKEKANFPMAFDEPNHRLLVVCRDPARLLVFDTDSGKQLASSDCVGDADDIWLDPQTRRVYITGGEGFISVIEQADKDHYRQLGKVPTAPGARTSLYVPHWQQLFVAVPHRGNQPAEVQLYSAAR